MRLKKWDCMSKAGSSKAASKGNAPAQHSKHIIMKRVCDWVPCLALLNIICTAHTQTLIPLIKKDHHHVLCLSQLWLMLFIKSGRFFSVSAFAWYFRQFWPLFVLEFMTSRVPNFWKWPNMYVERVKGIIRFTLMMVANCNAFQVCSCKAAKCHRRRQ